jgi:hypothetical protein
MLYAYGVVPAGMSASAAGVCFRDAGVRVAVREVAEKPGPTRDRLEEHHRVTLALAKAGGIVPFRFGTVFQDEHELAERLAPQAAGLAARLAALAGCVEMSIRVPAAAQSKPVSGAEYLRQKKVQFDAEERLAATVEAVAKEVRRGAGSLACLVEQRRLPEFRRAAEGLRVTGPWAPSSFV